MVPAIVLLTNLYFSSQYDVKKQLKFLKRIKYDQLDPKDLFVGNRVNVFSRQLNLIDYGDEYTATKLGSKKERYGDVTFGVDIAGIIQLLMFNYYTFPQHYTEIWTSTHTLL